MNGANGNKKWTRKKRLLYQWCYDRVKKCETQDGKWRDPKTNLATMTYIGRTEWTVNNRKRRKIRLTTPGQAGKLSGQLSFSETSYHPDTETRMSDTVIYQVNANTHRVLLIVLRQCFKWKRKKKQTTLYNLLIFPNRIILWKLELSRKSRRYKTLPTYSIGLVV